MRNRLLAMAAAASLIGPSLGHADIGNWRRPVSGEGTIIRHPGDRGQVGVRKRRAKYKAQRAANRQRRKLEARR